MLSTLDLLIPGNMSNGEDNDLSIFGGSLSSPSSSSGLNDSFGTFQMPCVSPWSNKTAAFIVDCLKEETTKEQIVDAMCAKYDAPSETISEDVQEILDKLNGIGAIEE